MDINTVEAEVQKLSLLSKLKSLVVSGLIKIPMGLISIAGLLTPSSLLIKGLCAIAIMAIPVGAYMKGRSDSTNICISNAAKAQAKKVKRYAKLKRDTAKLGKSRVDSSLTKWVQ